MKKIGLIGGIGPASTVEYYRLLIEGFRETLNTDAYPEIVLYSIDMTEMLGYVFSNQLDKLVAFLKDKISLLEAAGVEYAALASNTPHLVFNELAAAVNVNMISIVEATCEAIQAQGLKKVGLLGTKSTMSRGFYQRAAAHHGMEMVIPEEASQDYIHEKYMGELVFNQILPETKNRLIRIVEDLRTDHGIEGIVLGGTELPLILSQGDFDSLTVFNTTEIHVGALVDKMVD
ncbi:MAG TPA: aspartate/glutamate racemase family protein [Cytophagales bacterium]|nr:aspartate/glutamate racemase family protein [Cytophagales bacterium]HAA18067.1 aspartate/glutamate racemase family protein [Cytophagales bacterium]HAP62383.1 aspartate/glutamate racemase family protein [Cytophagales bacterium]